MKNRIFAAFAAATMLFSVSCSLNEDPYGFYSSDNFYNTEADAESGLMYAYNALNYLEYLRGIWYLGDIPTETMYPKPTETGDIFNLDKWTVDPNTELTQYYFKYCYIGINRANTVIKRVGEMDAAKISDAGRERIIGEAEFLRAWSYFNLVRSYGRVPFYTEPDQMTPPLATGLDQIYNQIIEDLTDAETKLTVNKVFGRVDIVAVQALMSKVYLHLASSIDYAAPGYTSYPGTATADDYYTLAAQYSRKVIEDYNDKYYYDEDLRHIYDVYAPDGPEHIFIMAIDRSGTHEGQYSKIPLQFLPHNQGTPIYIKYGNGDLQKANGNGWGVFIYEKDFVETAFQTIDKRRVELIQNKIYNEEGVEVQPYESVGEYFSVKYVDPDFNGEWTSARPYLIRFSDIALVFAEAVGPTTEGYAAVNHIRERAGIPDMVEGLSLEDFRKEVIKERALELAAEGNRLFDLRRTASVTATAGTKSTGTEADCAFYDIPQREIDLNPNVDKSNNNF
jgi:hypothetical protein